MEFYLVGGTVRDKLLGLFPKDKDWVVVGATEKKMLELGFTKIIASFPVFIHPKTKQEYALARSEKKVSKGYHGFKVEFSENTSLEDDLKRRDLTINSMAMDKHNNIIDPFGGRNDIKNRILRHTSKAFIEDPLRIVRLARFKAQLYDFNFLIARETKDFVKQTIEMDELKYLAKERLHIEFIKALSNPRIFLETLKDLNVLEIVFPNIKKLVFKIPKISFFDHKEYKQSSSDEKIVLTFLDIDRDTFISLKEELLLTNKQYKLLIATKNIAEIIETDINPERILFLIKNANLLRDKKLLDNSFCTYIKSKNILQQKLFIKKIKLLEKIIHEINTLDIVSIIGKTSKSNIKLTIKGLYLDTIKKHIKI